MTIFTKTAVDIFAPTDSGGSARNVVNGDVQVWGTEIEYLATLAFTSSLVYSTRAALYANLVPAANVPALVIGDPTAGYDGLYMKVGATTTGSWTRLGDVPGRQYIKATDAGAGTANAIVATTDIPLPSADRAAIITLNIYETNTATPVTVAFNGGSALTIKTMAGNDVAIGGLPANSVVAGYVSDSTFRLLSDQASAAIQAAAEAAQAGAEAAQAAAAGSAADAATSAGILSSLVTGITALWLTVLQTATYAEAWLALKINGSLSTRALIKALTPQVGMSVLLTEAGRVGNFVWRSGVYSDQIALDTAEGVFLKADSVAATVGAWVREFDILNVEHFGASPTGDPVTNRSAIQCAINVAQDYVGGLMIRNAYTISDQVVQTKAMKVWGYHSDRSKIVTAVGPALSLQPTAGIATDNTWWGWMNVAFITTAVGHYGIEYASTGNEYMSNWIMEGVKASGPAGGVLFDSTGSTVGIFSCTMRRNWWDNGSLFKDIGDSVHILENTINGNNIGIFIGGVKDGAQQLVIADNNITTRSECVYLLNVSAAHIDRNWMETPSYLGSYTGTTGALLYAQGCPNTRIERNTIQPLTAVMAGLGQTAAAYSIRLNTSGDASIIEGNRLIAIGTTGHIQIGGAVNNTYIKEDNKFDTSPVITDAGTGTFGAGNTPGIFNQLMTFRTATAFASVVSFESTEPGAGNGPMVDIYRNSASPADSDGLGVLGWFGNNTTQNKVNYTYIGGTINNASAGSETATMNFATYNAGVLSIAMSIGPNIIMSRGTLFAAVAAPATNDGAALGNTSNQWSDLFLATGGVINFANSDVTIMHSADALAFAGAANGYSFDNVIKISGNQVVKARETGWTAGTGTALKGAFAAYAGQTHTASYVQATVQALDNAARDASQRIKAIEDALRNHGLIN